jgi:hypothetical protein
MLRRVEWMLLAPRRDRHRMALWLGMVVALYATIGFSLNGLAPITTAQTVDQANVGQWSGVINLPENAVHAHVLPSGTVLYWPSWFGDAPARLWDPIANTTTNAPFAGYNIFCTGEVFMADGRLFVTRRLR